MQQRVVPEQHLALLRRERLAVEPRLLALAAIELRGLAHLLLAVAPGVQAVVAVREPEVRQAVGARHVGQRPAGRVDVLERDPRRQQMAGRRHLHVHRVAVQLLLAPELEGQRLRGHRLAAENQLEEGEDLAVQVEVEGALRVRVQIGDAVGRLPLRCLVGEREELQWAVVGVSELGRLLAPGAVDRLDHVVERRAGVLQRQRQEALIHELRQAHGRVAVDLTAPQLPGDLLVRVRLVDPQVARQQAFPGERPGGLALAAEQRGKEALHRAPRGGGR